MATTLFDYEKDLASGIHRSIAPEMAKLTDGNDINALVDRVATRIEAMIEHNWPRPPAAKLLACRAGCAFCCNQFEVQVSALEALRVSNHVRTTFTPERRQALDRRVDEIEAKRAAVPLNDRPFHTLPCPLLEDGHCSIYAVRPFICRSVTSFNVEVCKAHSEMTPAQVAEAHRLARKSRAPASIPEHGV
ncbi:MAG: YkgJ family cysteine cluster protein, partial [Rhodospirillales bacterium]|nr:YkgJ family cysteine cluster protein [Rhodospirillales bacterium]